MNTNESSLTKIQQFNLAIRGLVRKSTKFNYCNVSIEEGFLEIKVVEAVCNTINNGVSKIMQHKTLLALDVDAMVPIEYEGKAEDLGTTKYKLAEMVDELRGF
tara:strand:+ start:182926 stop:183234 length:309 start_codon:yes stop_codon:yes gene_type:complete